MSMELNLIHFYPDLMSLYGSYANLSVLSQTLEKMGNAVTITYVEMGDEADIEGADFLFMGAGTEKRQKFALEDFVRHGDEVKKAAEKATPMLFCGTAMELLGKTIFDEHGREYTGIGLGSFTAKQQTKRIGEDVYGTTSLYNDAVVGFMNKSSLLTGVETPFLTATALGFGNETKSGAEGFLCKNVIGSHLTGPILAKNPRLLERVIAAIYEKRGENCPAIPKDTWAEQGYAVTARELKNRCGK